MGVNAFSCIISMQSFKLVKYFINKSELHYGRLSVNVTEIVTLLSNFQLKRVPKIIELLFKSNIQLKIDIVTKSLKIEHSQKVIGMLSPRALISRADERTRNINKAEQSTIRSQIDDYMINSNMNTIQDRSNLNHSNAVKTLKNDKFTTHKSKSALN